MIFSFSGGDHIGFGVYRPQGMPTCFENLMPIPNSVPNCKKLVTMFINFDIFPLCRHSIIKKIKRSRILVCTILNGKGITVKYGKERYGKERYGASNWLWSTWAMSCFRSSFTGQANIGGCF